MAKNKTSIRLHLDTASEKAKDLIIEKAQEWNCTPAEALTKLMDLVSNGADREEAA